MKKTRIDDLAVLGGDPSFSDPLHVGRPNIGDRKAFLARVEGILDRRWFTNQGPLVEEFERRIAERVEVKHCLAVANGTIGLEILIRSVGLAGEVIVPSFTFVATAHALQWQGITPVFCDVAEGGHHIDPGRIEDLVTPRTSGIVGVHLWGAPCDVEGLQAVADRHGLALLFDAAHAFGCRYGGAPIGRWGEGEVFSFHATKFVNAFEGGAIVTDDEEIAQKVDYMRNFGFAGYDNVEYIGTNGKMSEVSAAMGLTSLEAMPAIIEANRRHYERYRERLSDLPGIEMFTYDSAEEPNFQYVILEIDEDAAGVNRDTFVEVLHAENVLARRYFYPGCHRMEPYRSLFPHAGMLLPNTEHLASRVISLPTGCSVTEEQVERVCELFRYVTENGREIADRMRSPSRDDDHGPDGRDSTPTEV